MANIVVTSLGDITANDGVTTLREALVLASGNAGSDNILFSGALSGTIVLMQGQLNVDSEVVINGDNNSDLIPDISIDAAGSSRVLNVTSQGTSSLTGLVIKGGSAAGDYGGGVFVDNANLSIFKSEISSNYAFSGGGIHVTSGSLMITDTMISGNTANYNGGGIAGRAATIDITGGVLSNNSVSGSFSGVTGGGAISIPSISTGAGC